MANTPDQIEETIAAIRAGLEGVPTGPWEHYSAPLRPNFPTPINEILGPNRKTLVAWSGFDASSAPQKSRKLLAAHIARLDPETVRTILDALDEVRAENARLRIALADAIRRPMGVIPESAAGLVSTADLDAAEQRRPALSVAKDEPCNLIIDLLLSPYPLAPVLKDWIQSNGVSYEGFEGQAMSDEFQLFGAKNVPDELPPWIRRAPSKATSKTTSGEA